MIICAQKTPDLAARTKVYDGFSREVEGVIRLDTERRMVTMRLADTRGRLVARNKELIEVSVYVPDWSWYTEEA